MREFPVTHLTTLLASKNEHKLAELRAALPGWKLELLDAAVFPPECGTTYYENALAKALFGREAGAPEAWILGEDSGIEVEALGGRPGIESARWAEQPIEELLRELEGVEDRRARYVCELVAVSPKDERFRGTGILEGRVAQEPRGNEGFGYDPIFIPESQQLTVALTIAELGNDWKTAHSHRARAAIDLLAALREAGHL